MNCAASLCIYAFNTLQYIHLHASQSESPHALVHKLSTSISWAPFISKLYARTRLHWKGQRVKLFKLWGKFGQIASIVPLGCSPVEGVIAIVIGFSCLQSLLLLLFCSQYNAECRLFLAPHYVSSLTDTHTYTVMCTHSHTHTPSYTLFCLWW